MLVHDKGDKDILGFICDMCTTFTSMDVIPNEHGEFRYICPRCGHHMKELLDKKEEETKMVNAYTVDNSAKRLNCSRTTIIRAIYDGRFHDCFTEIGSTGRPAWMIPSDQVEEWVTNGGFLLPRNGNSKFLSRKRVQEERQKAIKEVTGVPSRTIGDSDDLKLRAFEEFQKNVNGKAIAGRFPWIDPVKTKAAIEAAQNKLNSELKDKGAITSENVRKVFDPEVGKEVPVLNLFDGKPEPEDEFAKRAVKRVAKQPKWTKVLDRTETIKEETKMLDSYTVDSGAKRLNCTDQLKPVVRTDGGFSITIPNEMIEGIVKQQVKEKLGQKLAQLRNAINALNEELKSIEEAIA